MSKPRKCRACGQEFKPDARNQERQGYCSRPVCQRQRRTLAQRLRRQKPSVGAPPAGAPPDPPHGSRRLQAASLISEADIRMENPVIVGLISMVTGLTTFEDIERVYRQLWIRGREILSAGQPQTLTEPFIIRLLQQIRRAEGDLG